MPLPSLRSIIEYTLISIAAYIFVLAPLQTILLPRSWREWLAGSTSNDNSHTHSISLSTLIRPAHNISCLPHTYKTTLLSRSPLIIYIHSFLSPSESAHLLSLSEDSWSPSPVYAAGSQATVDLTVRNSSRAELPASDPIVRCLVARALAFQGWPRDTFVEQPWTQRYAPGGHYGGHFDWAGDLRSRRAGRVSTFMVYVSCDDCVGGGTTFPRLKRPMGDEWCDVVECDEQSESEGITFRPLAGNAIYWENFRADGRGWDELWHWAEKVEGGEKVGLNLWSWFQEGYGNIWREEGDESVLAGGNREEL